MSGECGRPPRLVALAAVAAISGFAALVAVRSYSREVREFFPERRPTEISAAASGLPGVETVAFGDRQGAVLHGWYVPSKNRAGIVLLHGAGGDRASLLPEARQLVSRGFGVLTFDWPGHGESDGEIHWSAGESRALVGAIDFLSAQADVDTTRIAAFGFSMGGAVLARVAPSDGRLCAVAFAGTPSDQVKQIDWENRQWGPLSQLPALWAVQRGGVPVYNDQPKDNIAAIAPRPVLIISGAQDETVPLLLAHELFAAARGPKELLVVDGAGHGGYASAPGSTYLDRVTGFFEGALLGGDR
jgi:uncharacterized protein